jgi:hypothetical protein
MLPHARPSHYDGPVGWDQVATILLSLPRAKARGF